MSGSPYIRFPVPIESSRDSVYSIHDGEESSPAKGRPSYLLATIAVGAVAILGSSFTLVAASHERKAAHAALAQIEAQTTRLTALFGSQSPGSPLGAPLGSPPGSRIPATSLAATPTDPISEAPKKFALDYMTPVAFQMSRGTCWMFAAVGVLEHSYRV